MNTRGAGAVAVLVINGRLFIGTLDSSGQHRLIDKRKYPVRRELWGGGHNGDRAVLNDRRIDQSKDRTPLDPTVINPQTHNGRVIMFPPKELMKFV
ncbi:hypothetical protein chiPu_0020387 [Chiloscyllium punctatum]|uniref:Uncharacterized protein n=1 Tax=Chiloscyllium punctatum TaxID=137246 RepID=A0A401RF29_CHIPU|nr:hypothetical protein [Chiloscyllium punctatum]